MKIDDVWGRIIESVSIPEPVQDYSEQFDTWLFEGEIRSVSIPEPVQDYSEPWRTLCFGSL